MHKNLIRFLFLLLVLPLAQSVAADSTDVETARATAARFLQAQRAGYVINPLSANAVNASALSLAASTDATYLFTTADNQFVLTAADDRLPAILGYGTSGSGEPPAALQALVKAYDRGLQLDNIAIRTTTDASPVVEPLLTFTRHQEAPYNNYCPYYTYEDGSVSETRCVVGCVATALEEVISYYRRTVTLVDTLHGWSTDNYTIDDILPGASVDTKLIQDDYNTEGTYTEEEADAVARLSYYLGVAVKMQYGVGTSGAYISAVEEPLRRAFGFGYVHYVNSYQYTPADWYEMLRNEIVAGRPVFYASYTMRLNGHAYVLDGLDANGFFHVNWGVNGDFDGYFRLDLLYSYEPYYDITEASLTEGYFCNQQAVLIHPDALDVTLPDTLARTGLEVVVDSVCYDLPPESGKVTPIRIFVHNSADYAVTTPLAIFTNTADAEDIYEDASYIALTSTSLAPGEADTLKVYPTFIRGTGLVLRITPDDEHILYVDTVTVEGTPLEDITFAPPEVSFPAVGTVELHQTMTNSASAGRAGRRATYEIFEGNVYTHNGNAHTVFCFLQPGESKTDTVFFHGLEPEQDYTIYVRYGWTIRDSVYFTLPSATSIQRPVTTDAESTDEDAAKYDLSGRRVDKSARRGIYIVGRKKRYLP